MTRPSFRILKIVLGIALIIFGFIALLVPFFPFAWVGFIGFELLGVRMAFWNKIKAWFRGRIKQSP